MVMDFFWMVVVRGGGLLMMVYRYGQIGSSSYFLQLKLMLFHKSVKRIFIKTFVFLSQLQPLKFDVRLCKTFHLIFYFTWFV